MILTGMVLSVAGASFPSFPGEGERKPPKREKSPWAIFSAVALARPPRDDCPKCGQPLVAERCLNGRCGAVHRERKVTIRERTGIGAQRCAAKTAAPMGIRPRS